jgi:hypothetical protein
MFSHWVLQMRGQHDLGCWARVGIAVLVVNSTATEGRRQHVCVATCTSDQGG